MPRRAPILRRMFHRRLLLLVALAVVPMMALTAQLGRLAVLQHDERAEIAESRLVAVRWLPTTRGRILDRNDRVLAEDRASYDLTIDYSVLSGRWARIEGAAAARRVHRASWGTLAPEAKTELIERFQALYAARVEAMWPMLAELTQRPEDELREAARQVTERVERMHRYLVNKRLENLVDAEIESRRTVDGIDIDRLRDQADQPIRPQREHHVIASDVGDDVGFRIYRFLDTEIPLSAPALNPGDESATEITLPLLPGIAVRDTVERVYPHDEMTVTIDTATFPAPLAAIHTDQPLVEASVFGVAAPILGRMRETAYAEDSDRRARALASDPYLQRNALTARGTDRGQYRPGDPVGHSGLEAAQEHRLRGLRGVRIENLETGDVEETPPTHGRDLKLTLDARLQARVRALMDPALGLSVVQSWHGPADTRPPEGTHLYGGAAVLDVATGEILALVSTPTEPRDGDWQAAYGLEDNQVQLFRDLLNPEVHKAIAKPYPPGSVAKALILTGAEHFGVYDLNERIPATGHLYPERPDMLRSWIFKQYGLTHRDQLGRDPDGTDALMVSSNVFFFTLGMRLGPEQIAATYHMYGLGESFNLGIGPEFPGKVGPFAGPGDGTDLSRGDAIQMGIGQGPVTWTPLHAAAAYATLARRGVYVKPRIFQDGEPPEARQLPISQGAITVALEGLRKVVSDPDYATGRVLNTPLGEETIWNVPGVTVWGKTGTATAPPLTADPDGPDGPQESMTFLSGDHSWFVVMAGENRHQPRYVVAVVMDYAGSGGRVSGPIANQIIHALADEGYLQTTATHASATQGRRTGGGG